MELRLLKYFAAVVQEENVTRAAQLLHITQPTLSRQLTQLEEELGTVLLERGKKKVVLTADGAVLYQKALEILELTEKAEQTFKEKNLVGGTISIGTVESTASMFLSELISQFVREYPAATFDLYNNYSQDVRERLDRGLIDVGLLMESGNLDKYHFVRMPQKDVWGILARRDDPLARREELSVRELGSLPLIIPSRESVRREIENWVQGDGKLNVFATYNLLSNGAFLVEKGLGYAVTLNSCKRFCDITDTVFIPFTPEKTAGSVFVWKRHYAYSPIVNQFIRMVRDNFEQKESL